MRMSNLVAAAVVVLGGMTGADDVGNTTVDVGGMVMTTGRLVAVDPP